MDVAIIVTCEHASKAIPKQYRSFYHSSILASHEGYDLGAREYAIYISRETKWPLYCGKVSRLLVDLNRSYRPFSSISKKFDRQSREEILKKYYRPFRASVFELIRERVQKGYLVVHLSCHSFTPIWRGSSRSMDVGILYDPKRRQEVYFADRFVAHMTHETSLRLRRNAPYKGTSDGHVTDLRKKFPAEVYIGIELEISQALCSPRVSKLWTHSWLPIVTSSLKESCQEVSLCL